MRRESLLADMLKCPRCGAEGLSAGATELVCSCESRFPIRGGVLHMSEQHGPSKTVSQEAMRFKPLIRVYDVFWRHMTFPFITFIPLAKEAGIILGYHDLRPGNRILDLACGPGTYTRRFAKAVGKSGVVVGADASLPMLDQAVRSSQEEGFTNTAFILTRADRLPFQPGQFHGINCTGALHLFDSVEPVFRSVASLLKPGGVFSCMTFCQSPFKRINDAYQRLGIQLFDPGSLESMLRKEGLAEFKTKISRRMLLFSVRKVT